MVPFHVKAVMKITAKMVVFVHGEMGNVPKSKVILLIYFLQHQHPNLIFSSSFYSILFNKSQKYISEDFLKQRSFTSIIPGGSGRCDQFRNGFDPIICEGCDEGNCGGGVCTWRDGKCESSIPITKRCTKAEDCGSIRNGYYKCTRGLCSGQVWL